MTDIKFDEDQIRALQVGHYNFEIKGTETDFQDRLHIASLLAVMQEAAYKNVGELEMGAPYLDPLNICWLLSKLSVRVDSLPQWLDNLIVCTWSRGTKRLMFLRDFTFYHTEIRPENILGHASSEWFLATRDTHRPLRPGQVIDQEKIKDHQKAPAVFSSPCPRLKNLELAASDQPIIEKYADYSEIDRNGHVNNTRYAAWAVDAVQAYLGGDSHSLAPFSLAGFDIQFISEITYGSKIKLYLQEQSSNQYLVEGQLATDKQVAFRSQIELAQGEAKSH